MVFCSKISRGDSDNPAAFAADASWMDMIESPPSAKKDSVTETVSRPSSPATIAARVSSAVVAGATYPSAGVVNSGTGSARRSSLPPGVTGSSSSTIAECGIMCPASRSAAPARTASASRRSPAVSSPTR